MRALVAMSGGVDSSVAAFLTKKNGIECVGCTMKLFDAPEDGRESKTCCSLNDVEDARSVAFRLGMPYYVFNFKDGFSEKVISRFIHCYENGMTPNPCIDCNRFMKFEKLFERAEILNCGMIVTGHYARIEERDGSFLLKKALDETKDQSYVLYSLSQEQLGKLSFPLGSLRKTEVREIARENDFVNSDKPDSQDICFVPDGNYAGVIRTLTGKNYPEGPFIGPDGTRIGTHKGIIHYTVGQRKGLGISYSEPLFVRSIEPESNRVVLGTEQSLYTDEVFVKNVHWISGVSPSEPITCAVRTRYRQREKPAEVIPVSTTEVKLRFGTPVRAATPGQAAVFYDGDIVLGGGEIAAKEKY